MIRSRIVAVIIAVIIMTNIGVATAYADDTGSEVNASQVTSVPTFTSALPHQTGPATWAQQSVDQFATEMGLTQVHWVTLESGQMMATPCNVYSSRNAYVYCPSTDTAYIGLDQADYFNEGTNPLAAALLTAHEWGHHLQRIKGTKQFSQAKEDGADCVGGAWLKWHTDRKGIQMTPADAIGFYELAVKIERPVWMPNDPHGTRWDRSIAIGTGYFGGLAACNRYSPVM